MKRFDMIELDVGRVGDHDKKGIIVDESKRQNLVIIPWKKMIIIDNPRLTTGSFHVECIETGSLQRKDSIINHIYRQLDIDMDIVKSAKRTHEDFVGSGERVERDVEYVVKVGNDGNGVGASEMNRRRNHRLNLTFKS